MAPPNAESTLVEAGLMADYENAMWPEFPLRCAVSQFDCETIDGWARVGRTVLAPNGCDLSMELVDARPDLGTRRMSFFRPVVRHIAVNRRERSPVLRGSSHPVPAGGSLTP